MAVRPLAIVPVLATLLSAGAALAHGWHDSFNINVHRDGEPQSCADIEVEAGSRAVATAEQSLTVPRSSEPLQVNPASNSGVSFARASSGGIQLFVGPASSLFAVLMNVRCSVRATSCGALRCR